MNQQVEKRIYIIHQLNSILIGNDFTLEKRIKRLRWGYFGYALANLSLIFLLLGSASTLFHFKFMHYNWNKSMLLVGMAISLSFHSHFSFIGFILSKHQKKLNESNFTFDQELNSELENLINKLNCRRFKPYWIKIPSILVMISALVILFLAEETMTPTIAFYWNQFPLPVFILSILLIWNINYMVFSVKRNIDMVESERLQ